MEINVCEKRKAAKKKAKRGSLTVEASLLMGVVLLVLMGVLYLFFWVHNRAWLTAAAYESAVSGSMEAMTQDGNAYETAQEKSKELGNTGFFGAENLTVQTNVGSNVQVTYDLDTISGFGGFSWHLQAQGKAKLLKPVSWIRKVKGTSEIVEGFGG